MKTLHHPNRAPGTGVRRTQTAGFALIEVLVAVLLFAIGILGIVGLQASMLQAQTDSKVRADAANLVDEVAALMWSQVNKGKPAPATLASIVQYKAGTCAGDLTCNGWLDQVARPPCPAARWTSCRSTRRSSIRPTRISGRSPSS